jgi:hypothetical protein
MKRLLAFAAAVMMSCGQVQSPGTHCVLVAGVGCGKLVLGKTRRTDFLPDARTEDRFSKQGMTFTFDANDTLDSIVVADNRAYKTDRGISPDDREERVLQAYGKPAESGRPVLYKGENEPIGAVGDRALVYPGILFIIYHEHVWAIVIGPR